MPILCKFDVVPMSRSQFYEIDHLVMKHSFSIQNELGRLYDEHVYQIELLRRCTDSGIIVRSESEIVVSFESFKKSYYLDALMNCGSICELKAVETLNGQHESQLLNYLLLSNLQFGKLINFSSPSVQYRFVTTTLNAINRMSYEVDDATWSTEIPSGKFIREIVQNLLVDWGVYLDVNLYREAVCHFLGGDDVLMQPVNIFVNNYLVGHQRLCCLDEETCLHISSTIRHFESYKKQLLKIFEHTSLKQIQWINFNRATVQLITLKK